jgi:hypothetical protein
MKTAFAALALTTAIAASACGTDDGINPKNFVGTYRTTLTVSGQGSSTLTDSVSISEGATSDLIVTSQNIGAMRATIISESAFVFDQQSIMLSNDGVAFSANLEGQGTATGGVLNVNGTLSTTNGSLSFAIAGSRL